MCFSFRCSSSFSITWGSHRHESRPDGWHGEFSPLGSGFKKGDETRRLWSWNLRPPNKRVDTWNMKHPFIHGCFNWMIPNLYINRKWLEITKHLFINGCLGFQELLLQGFLGFLVGDILLKKTWPWCFWIFRRSFSEPWTWQMLVLGRVFDFAWCDCNTSLTWIWILKCSQGMDPCGGSLWYPQMGLCTCHVVNKYGYLWTPKPWTMKVLATPKNEGCTFPWYIISYTMELCRWIAFSDLMDRQIHISPQRVGSFWVKESSARWWFQFFFIFIPITGEMVPFD